MDEEQEPLSRKKLKELLSIAEGRTVVARKTDLIKIFTRAGATNTGNDQCAVLQFGDRKIPLVLNAGRNCSQEIAIDFATRQMAHDLYAHATRNAAEPA